MTDPVRTKDVLKQQVQMLNLVLDLEQKRTDTAFHLGAENVTSDPSKDAGPGKIHYVLDENVFEMFIHPRRMKSYARTFYSQFWLKISSQHARWAEFAAQSALVASEYLLSGELPGQEGRRLYMTEWHRGELTRRMADLFMEIRDQIHAEEMEESGSELEATLKTLLAIRQETNERERERKFREFVSKDRLLAEDLELLSDGNKTPQENLHRFAAARIAARMLANDTTVEPLEQILRLSDKGKDVESRIFNITSKFSPRGSDLQLVDTWARNWHRNLQLELEFARRPDGERSPAALWNDARSLALVTWVASKCERSRERVVLVTGDQIMFNAYRRWFVNAHTLAPGEPGPFALRRLVQYTPILNLNGEFSDISGADKLMEATQQAMEVSLLPFNLSNMTSPERPGSNAKRRPSRKRDPEAVRRGREYLTLKYVDSESTEDDIALSYFTDKLPGEWFEERKDELQAVCALWKQNERIAIGSMYRLIEIRLRERERLVAKALEKDGSARIGDLLAERAKYLMGRILDTNVSFWLPAAGKFVFEELKKGVGDRGQLVLRVPIFPTIVLRAGGKEYDLVDIIGRGLGNPDPEIHRILLFSERTDRDAEPELAFAVASTLALALCNWRNADIYADLAVRAASIGPDTVRGPATQPFELRYLHAVAKRFRVGEIGKPIFERTAGALWRRYRDAKDILDQCAKFHEERHRSAVPADPPDIFPLMRALSERAALRGFYAAAIGMAKTGKWEQGETNRKRGMQALREAAIDLTACNNLAAEAKRIATGNERCEKYLARLRRQFVSNLAALRVVNRLLYSDAPLPPDFPRDGEIVDMLTNLGLPDASLPALVKAEIAAFFLMVGRDIEKGRNVLDSLRQSAQTENLLPLDRELLAQICDTDIFGD